MCLPLQQHPVCKLTEFAQTRFNELDQMINEIDEILDKHPVCKLTAYEFR